MKDTKQKNYPTGADFGIFETLGLLRYDLLELVAQLIAKHGDITYHKLPFKRFYIFQRPEHIQYILQGNSQNYLKDSGYGELSLLLGNGLISAEGSFWQSQRKMIQPVFKRSNIEALLPVMEEELDAYLGELAGHARAGTAVDILADMMGLTLRIITATMFGRGIDVARLGLDEALLEAQTFIINRITNPFKLPMFIPLPDVRRFYGAKEKLQTVVRDIISKRRKEIAAGYDGSDLLTRLLKLGGDGTAAMSDEQLLDEILTIFVAGHETTAIALTMTIFLLAQNPKAVSEIRNENKTTAGIKDFEYTKYVIQESMRLYPPVWSIGRRPINDDEVDGYFIEKGVDVFTFPILLQRNPEYWPEPDKFKPERFSESYNPGAYFPFGLGPRTCIGNTFAMSEMILVLSKLVARFDFTIPSGYEMKLNPMITIHPKEKLRVTFKEV